jgi:hypothetical protein
MERPPEESHGMKVLQPLAVRHVALAPRDVFHMLGVDQADLNALFLQDLEQGNPGDPSGLHVHRVNAALL